MNARFLCTHWAFLAAIVSSRNIYLSECPVCALPDEPPSGDAKYSAEEPVSMSTVARNVVVPQHSSLLVNLGAAATE
jgi:hypothetical protein